MQLEDTDLPVPRNFNCTWSGPCQSLTGTWFLNWSISGFRTRFRITSCGTHHPAARHLQLWVRHKHSKLPEPKKGIPRPSGSTVLLYLCSLAYPVVILHTQPSPVCAQQWTHPPRDRLQLSHLLNIYGSSPHTSPWGARAPLALEGRGKLTLQANRKQQPWVISAGRGRRAPSPTAGRISSLESSSGIQMCQKQN